jgi:hypothetical protein
MNLHQYRCTSCNTAKMFPEKPAESFYITAGCDTCGTIRRWEADYSREAALIKGWL